MQTMAQDIVRVRTDSEVKQQVAEIAENLGMNTSTAVNMFFRAFIRSGGMPFDVTIGESAEERAEINRILDERTKEANDPNTKWLTGENVKKIVGLD